MVSIPKPLNVRSVFLPMPGSSPMGSGAKKALSFPAATSSKPSGLAFSEATLATSLELAMPTEALMPISSLIRCLIFSAIRRMELCKDSKPVTSRKASSIPTGSIKGEKSIKIAMNFNAASRYF